MKLICLQENLKTKLNIAEKIIGRNLTLPILNNVSLSTDKGRLKISSTNLEIGINTWVPGKVSEEGGVCVPAKTFANLINNLPAGKISLEAKKNALFIKTEKYKAAINGFSQKDFPIIPKPKEDKNKLTLDAETLKNCLEQTIFAAAVSDLRPEISGVFMSLAKGTAKFVSTDSFRLVEKTEQLKEKQTPETALIVPLRTAQELARVFGDQNEPVKIVFSPNQILFETETTQLVSRLIEGAFPNYQQIVPKQFKTQLTADKNELLNTIKLTSVLSGKLNDIKIKIDPEKQQMEVAAQDSELGENQSLISAKITGEPLEIVFNHKYLSEGLQNIAAEQVFFGLNGPTSPVLIKPAKNIEHLYVLMPIKPM